MQELCILQRQDINALIRLMGIVALSGDLSKCQHLVKTPKAHSIFIRIGSNYMHPLGQKMCWEKGWTYMFH